MNINGAINLRFKKVGTYVMWLASVSNKDKDGNIIWISIPVTLSKKVEEEVKNIFKETKFKTDDKYITIDVKNGFISGYKDKENKSVVKLVITELAHDTKEDKVEIPF